MQKAMFAEGCFWGVEERFRQVPGVVEVTSGYSGGHTENPTYREVCSGTTGHAEVVLIEFDPARVGYEQLLDVFWASHDPTTRNRQGPDIGEQYRSAIFYFDAAQKAAAEASRDRVNRDGRFRTAVVTEITAAGPFYPAEDYHQRYLQKHGRAHCAV